MVRLSFVLVALLAASCASVQSGAALDPAVVQSLEVGVATRAQVEARLGQPTQVVEQSNGASVLSYAHITSSANSFTGSATAQATTAAFVFDADGVLQRKSTGASDARPGR